MEKTKYKLFSYYNLSALCILSSILLLGHYTYTNIELIKITGTSLYEWLNKQNPMIAGAVSLWALGSASWLARGVPKGLWNAIIKQTTVVLTLNNIDDVYDHFLRWYHHTGRSNSSRTLLVKNAKYGWFTDAAERGMDVSAGYGAHYFMFGGKPFRLKRELKEAANTKDVKETMTLTTIGRSQAVFHQLIVEITPEEMDENLTSVYKWKGGTDGYWKSYSHQPVRKFDSVILPQKTKDKIVSHIETFLASRGWYMDHGIPYRTGLIFHGIPGTGKTSLVRALCEKFKKPLYIISLSGITDAMLEQALAELPRNSLMLLEDVDTYSVTNKRTSTPSTEDEKGESSNENEFSQLTLSGLLNAIDGILASDGRILIATTNYINKLDSALTRKGRFNISVEIGYLSHECFIEFFDKFYPEFTVPPDTKFKKTMTPADLQASIMDNIENPSVVFDFCVDESFRKNVVEMSNAKS